MRCRLGLAAASLMLLASTGCQHTPQFTYGGPTAQPPQQAPVAMAPQYGGAPPGGSVWGNTQGWSNSNVPLTSQQTPYGQAGNNGYATRQPQQGAVQPGYPQPGVTQTGYNYPQNGVRQNMNAAARDPRELPASRPYNPRTGGFDPDLEPRWPEEAEARAPVAQANRRQQPMQQGADRFGQSMQQQGSERFTTPTWPPSAEAPEPRRAAGPQGGDPMPEPRWPDTGDQETQSRQYTPRQQSYQGGSFQRPPSYYQNRYGDN